MFVNRKEVNSQDVISLSNLLGITPELAMVLLKRNKGDVVDVEYLRNYLYNDSLVTEPFPNVREAVTLLLNRHIMAGCKIAIINDYDVDGIMSGFIASKMLEFLGIETVVITSDRINEGYSITKGLVNRAKEAGASMIITTDNGITAFEPIAYAKELGLEVLLTDHHEPINEDGIEHVPDADVIVEPKLDGCTYPMREICGAVVILKVAEYLLSEENLTLLGKTDLIEPAKELIGGFYELAGIATITDVMPLRDENRIIVRHALRRLNAGSYFVGLRMLCAVLNIECGKITSHSIGFGIGPCFNAESRMTGKTDIAMQLLATRDNTEAERLATELKRFNEERKELSNRLEAEHLPAALASDDKFIFTYAPNELHTVMGILAGRITEQTGKPCLVFTDSPNGMLTGSGRSTVLYNLIEGLREHDDVFESLGGHAGACGASIRKDNYEVIKQVMNSADKDIPTLAQDETLVDLYINPSVIRPAFLDEICLLEPYGEDNVALCMVAEQCVLHKIQPLGKTGDYRKCLLTDNKGNPFEALLFSRVVDIESYITEQFGADALDILSKGQGQFVIDMSYRPQYHTWDGKIDIQFIMRDIQKVG